MVLKIPASVASLRPHDCDSDVWQLAHTYDISSVLLCWLPTTKINEEAGKEGGKSPQPSCTHIVTSASQPSWGQTLPCHPSTPSLLALKCGLHQASQEQVTHSPNWHSQGIPPMPSGHRSALPCLQPPPPCHITPMLLYLGLLSLPA